MRAGMTSGSCIPSCMTLRSTLVRTSPRWLPRNHWRRSEVCCGPMAAELEPIGVEGQDFFVVEKNDKRIVVPIRKEGQKYHVDPQIRAFQMVQEGRFGGAGRGQGRKPVAPRAAQRVAEEIRKRADKIVAALDAGLAADSVQTRLKAAGMALEIEREETLLQLKEEQQEAELDSMS